MIGLLHAMAITVQLAIFIQRWCAIFSQRKVWFFTGAKFFVAGLWTL